MAHGRNQNAATALAQSGPVVGDEPPEACGWMGCLNEDQVWQYVSGRVDRPGEAGIQRHMDSCRACCLVIAEAARTMAGTDPAEPAGDHRGGPLTLRTGEVILERYRVIRFVARGGMGEVYEVRDSVLDETIALKTLVSTALDSPAAMSRFLAEARAARRVTHPNVCRILEFGFHRLTSLGPGLAEQIPFLTMEFLRGETLDRRIARQGRLDPAEVAALLPSIIAGLQAIHGAGVVHRDIKPQNIMVLPGPPERPVLTDFGVARRIYPDPSRSTTITTGAFVIGTVDYMSPEQLANKPPATSFDIFALGVVIFEMLTGNKPWSAQAASSTAVERRSGSPGRPSALVPGLDPAWDDLVLRCLAREPRDRFARVEEIRPPVRRNPRRRGRWALGALAVAAAGALGLWLTRDVHRPGVAAAIAADATRLTAVLSSRPPGAAPPQTNQRIFVASGCSEDMVKVAAPALRPAGSATPRPFCIDRFEASTVDDVAGRRLSPLYPPWTPLALSVREEWRARRRGGGGGSVLPALPTFELADDWRPRAVSQIGAAPQGYLSRPMAAAACTSAGKRLCTESEWTVACRGDKNTRFPYGDSYEDGLCNLGRGADGSHPSTPGDPRLNQITTQGRGGLQETGDQWRCRSQWGSDFVYDMVGNLGEWVDGAEPLVAGGQYRSDGRGGCDQTSGPIDQAYWDHSTGFRCCDGVHAGPPAQPAFQVAGSGSRTYAAHARLDGFESDSAAAADLFSGRPVLFLGCLYGGSQEQLSAGGAYLVYRFRLTFPGRVRIAAISVSGAGDQRDDSQIRLLDGKGRVLAATGTRGFKTLAATSLRPNGAVGSTFVLEEYDHSGRYRYRSKIDVVAEAIN
jgi:protein kinase-like protein/sulfatase-modifying factor enzyme 1